MNPIETGTNWVDEINAAFVGDFAVMQVLGSEPRLVNLGAFTLADHLQLVATHCRDGVKKNDVHAILESIERRGLHGVELHYRTIDFAGIVALRSIRRRPPILSACTVLFSDETREVFFHRRSKYSATYPGKLHTVGGSFAPEPAYMHPADPGLVATACREVLEETGLRISFSEYSPMVLCREMETGFVQLLVLGHSLPAAAVGRLLNAPKHNIESISFDDLEGFVCGQEDVVTSGRGHLLVWLALGAPGSDPGAWRREGGPRAVYSQVIEQLRGALDA